MRKNHSIGRYMEPLEKRRFGPMRAQKTALVAYPWARGQVNYHSVRFLVFEYIEEMAYVIARIWGTDPFDIPHGPEIYCCLG